MHFQLESAIVECSPPKYLAITGHYLFASSTSMYLALFVCFPLFLLGALSVHLPSLFTARLERADDSFNQLCFVREVTQIFIVPAAANSGISWRETTAIMHNRKVRSRFCPFCPLNARRVKLSKYHGPIICGWKSIRRNGSELRVAVIKKVN